MARAGFTDRAAQGSYDVVIIGGAMLGAVHAPQGREAALVCFVVTTSGVAFLGIGGAFWGLLAGGAMLLLARWRG